MAIKRDKLDVNKLKSRALEVMKGRVPVSDLQLTEAEMLGMIHEIEVYRIELKMMQEELDRADEKVDDFTKKYDKLSDIHNKFILHVIKGHKYPGHNNLIE